MAAESQPVHKQYAEGDLIGGEHRVLAVFGGKGKSGQGVVYLVEHPDAPDPFVLKTFQSLEPVARDHFIHEAEMWVSMGRHPNLVPAIWVRLIDDVIYIAAEYVALDAEGRNNLGHHIQDGPQPVSRICLWAVEFCDAMLHALAKGMLAHCDIKPDNLMVDSAGHLRVTDFGLANFQRDPSTSRGVTGTPPFMAPEQFFAPDSVDSKVDVYAFGLVLYLLATGGKYPYAWPAGRSDLRSMAEMHLTQSPMQLGSPLDPVIASCLQKQAKARPSFPELRELVARVATQQGVKLPLPARGPDEADQELYARAQSFVAIGKPKLALEAIDAYVRRWPENACGWTEKGKIHLEMGDDAAAIAATLESLKLDPQNTHAWNNIGVAQWHLGDRTEATESFRAALLSDPYNTGAMMQLAFLLTEAGQTGEASRLFTTALKLRPQKRNLLFNAGNAAALMAKQHAVDDALPVLEELVVADHENATPWFNLALVYQQRGDTRRAIDCYRKTVSLNPKDSAARLFLAPLLAECGELQAALEHCDACMDDSEQRTRALIIKAQILRSAQPRSRGK